MRVKNSAGIMCAAAFFLCGQNAASKNVGKMTCSNVEKVFTHLNDGTSISFCTDANRDCKSLENMEKMPHDDPLRQSLMRLLPAQLNRNLQLCSLAILTYNPSYYDAMSNAE